LCAEGLSALIKKAEGQGIIHGVKICNNAPIISHLLFADDCFLFFKGSADEANVMKGILATYEAASGQAINLQKSEIFCSRNTPTDVKTDIANIMGVRQVLGTGKYLGVPSMVGRSKSSTFKFIKDRIWKKNQLMEQQVPLSSRKRGLNQICPTIHSFLLNEYFPSAKLVNQRYRKNAQRFLVGTRKWK